AQLTAVGRDGRLEEALFGGLHGQASATARYHARQNSSTAGSVKRAGARTGCWLKIARALRRALSGAVRENSARLRQVGPRSRDPGCLRRNAWKCRPYQAAWASTALRSGRTCRCSTTASGTKAVARPAARARRIQSKSSLVTSVSSKGPTRANADSRAARL